MELSSLFGAYDAHWIDDFLVWAVASSAGIIGLVTAVNALDMFFDAEAG